MVHTLAGACIEPYCAVAPDCVAICALQAVVTRQGVFSSVAAKDQNWNREYNMHHMQRYMAYGSTPKRHYESGSCCTVHGMAVCLSICPWPS